jgi:hypothetical protein
MGAKPKRVAIDQSVLARLEKELRDRAISEGTNLFPELDELSKATTIEDIDIDEGSLEVTKERDGKLRVDGVVNVYVTLNYGDTKDSVSHNGAFPGLFSALVTDSAIQVENTSVDTSSFYE